MFASCDRDRRILGLCLAHYKQQREGKPLQPLRFARPRTGYPSHCAIDGCPEPSSRVGYCESHYDMTLKYATHRRAYLKRTYGLTPEQYAAMVEAHGGVCAICQKPEKRRHSGRRSHPRPLAVDHNATTGAVRGLLCNDCNVAIGLLGHDIELLSRAITYLGKDHA